MREETTFCVRCLLKWLCQARRCTAVCGHSVVLQHIRMQTSSYLCNWPRHKPHLKSGTENVPWKSTTWIQFRALALAANHLCTECFPLCSCAFFPITSFCACFTLLFSFVQFSFLFASPRSQSLSQYLSTSLNLFQSLSISLNLCQYFLISLNFF